jgi:uncharacterized RDD family membrane protein YckC
LQTPSLLRRLGSLLYEGLTVIALWLLASALVTTFSGFGESGISRTLLQGIALVIISGYFLWCWTHGGQTLAMKTWRIQVIDDRGKPLSTILAASRLVLASVGVCLAGVGLWWALLDKDKQFLHDRLAHTRLILLKTV